MPAVPYTSLNCHAGHHAPPPTGGMATPGELDGRMHLMPLGDLVTRVGGPQVAAGRIGLAVLRRMHPFDCKLHYCDRHRLPKVPAPPALTHTPHTITAASGGRCG